MPLKVIADYRELLIDIFFAIIITVGLEKFLYDFLLTNLHKLSSFDTSSLISIFAVPETSINTFLFFAAYFWVISHWVFYHELIKKYPYYNQRKFFVDVTLFSIMFVVISISYSAYDIEISQLFILLVVVWYFFACLWHVADKELRPVGRYVRQHIMRLVTYVALLLLLCSPFSVYHIIPLYRAGVMGAMIIAMIAWNVIRLSKYLSRDFSEFRCDYVRGYPGWDSQRKKGKLELVRNPMKCKIRDKKNDTITFYPKGYAKGSSDKINVPAENVIDATIITSEDDLLLEINYLDKNEDIKLVLNLDDQVILGVQNTIKKLSRHDRKMSMAQLDNVIEWFHTL